MIVDAILTKLMRSRDKTQNMTFYSTKCFVEVWIKYVHKKNGWLVDTLTTDKMYSRQPFLILRCFSLTSNLPGSRHEKAEQFINFGKD